MPDHFSHSVPINNEHIPIVHIAKCVYYYQYSNTYDQEPMKNTMYIIIKICSFTEFHLLRGVLMGTCYNIFYKTQTKKLKMSQHEQRNLTNKCPFLHKAFPLEPICTCISNYTERSLKQKIVA